MPTAVIAASFDSQLKWAAHIRNALEARGVACRVAMPDLRGAISDQQMRDTGVDRVERMTWTDMLDAALDADMVVSSLAGPVTRRLTMEIRQRADAGDRRPPVLVSGWIGIIIERKLAGYLDRCGCDVVAVNSREDFADFEAAAALLGLPIDNMIIAGLPFLPSTRLPQESGPIRTVLFADQPTIPTDPEDRLYVYRRLIEYARAHPDRQVILKPRHRKGEDTYHPMKFHPEDLLAGTERPANFRIGYEAISDCLPGIDLMLTVSSTACLEAIAAGKRTALVADMGVHEKYGNAVLLKSGLLRTFDDIAADRIGAPDEDWASSYFPGLAARPGEIVAERALALLRAGIRPADGVWATPYMRGVSRFQLARSDLSLPPDALAAIRTSRGRDTLKWRILYRLEATFPPALVRPCERMLRRWRVI